MEWNNPLEQLPEKCGEYLVVHKYYGILKRELEYEVVFYDGEKTWWGSQVSYSTSQIVAWCKLPELSCFVEVE